MHKTKGLRPHLGEKMDIISSKQVLNQIIRECMYQDEETNIPLPKSVLFCEGLGCAMFKITIEKMENDTFIDAQGNEWKKVKDSK